MDGWMDGVNGCSMVAFDCHSLMTMMVCMIRVFRVNRKAISSQSIAGDSSNNGPEGVLPALEICYHTKEAWNIFEVPFLSLSLLLCNDVGDDDWLIDGWMDGWMDGWIHV